MFDLAFVKRRHKAFLAGNREMIAISGEEAAEFVKYHVNQHPGFRPRSGALQRETRAKFIRTRTGGIVRAQNPKKYAASIDSGARAHPIYARRAPLLRFYWKKKGRWVSTKKVNHPGNRPYKFLYRATHAAWRVLAQRAEVRAARLARSF